MIKVIFFDVDGTLVSHTKGEVSASTRAALTALREKGILCVLATGRHMPELEDLPIRDITFDAYITLNGHLSLDAEGNVTYGLPFVGAEKEQVLRLFARNEVPVMLVEQGEMYLNFVDRRVEAAQKEISSPIYPLGRYTGGDIYQAVIYAEKEDEPLLHALLPDCRLTRWNDHGVDVIARGGGKMAGIRQYLAASGILPEETMAFGDGENDAEMLEFAGIGVAMGNAPDSVKASADYVTDSVDEDGVAKALRQFHIL